METTCQKNPIIGPHCVFNRVSATPKTLCNRGLLFAILIQLVFSLAPASKQMQFRSSGHNASCLYILNLKVEKFHKSHLGDESPLSSGEQSAVVLPKKEKREAK